MDGEDVSTRAACLRRRVTELRGEMTGRALGRLVDAMASAAEALSYLSRKGKSGMVRLSVGHQAAGERRIGGAIAALEGRQDQRRIA
jgi:hypothetical protein